MRETGVASPGRGPVFYRASEAGSMRVAQTLARVGGGVLAFALTLMAGCNRPGPDLDAPAAMQLTSEDIREGLISRDQTCDGRQASPALSWSPPPAGTQSLALTVTDEDSRFGYRFVHWVAYNIPPHTASLPAGLSNQAEGAAGLREGKNDAGETGYKAPCPPAKSVHTYQFVIYAVDRGFPQLQAADKRELLQALAGHVLAKGVLAGRYGR